MARIRVRHCVAALALVVGAGCGDDDEGGTVDEGAGAPTTAGGGETTTSAVAEPTGEPVTIMVTGMIEAPVGAFPGVPAAAEAAAESINARGGINGHPVEIVQCNDERDAAKASACAQEAIDLGVTAVTGVLLFGPQYIPPLEAAGIPVLGSVLTIEEKTSAISFPLTSSVEGEYTGIGYNLVQDGHENIVVLRSESAAGGVTAGNVAAGVELAGGAAPQIITVQSTAADFTPFAASAIDADPDAVVLVVNDAANVRIENALRQQGFEGPIGLLSNGLQPESFEPLADKDGTYWASTTLLPEDNGEDVSNLGQFGEDMQEYASEFSLFPAVTRSAWMAVAAVAQALEGVEGDPDAAALRQALESTPIDLSPLLPEPVDFSQEGPNPQAPRIQSYAVIVYEVVDGIPTPRGDFVDPYLDAAGN